MIWSYIKERTEKAIKSNRLLRKLTFKLATIKEKSSNYAKRIGKEAANSDESDTDNESNNDDDSNSNGSSDDDMVQMMAMIVRGFKNMKFRR